MNWSKEFTSDQLKDIIDNISRRGTIAPSPSDLVDLAVELNLLRLVNQQYAGPSRVAAERGKRVLKAAAEIKSELPALVDHIDGVAAVISKLRARFGATSRKISVHNEAQILKQVYDALTRLESMGNFIFPRSYDPSSVDWKRWAWTIAELFQESMAAANPGRRFGYTPEGPLTKFISAVIPQITGQSVKHTTVADFLKKNPRSMG